MNTNPHPRWLEPEKAQLLDQNGFRRSAARDLYIAGNGPSEQHRFEDQHN
jgi:hypothetical protein